MKLVDLSIRPGPPKRPGIALAIPMETSVPRKSIMSMMLMMSHSWQDGDVFITGAKVAAVHVARNEIVKMFLEQDPSVEFLVMLDSDMVVPTNLIDIWVGNPNARLPFVSGYCTRKEWPFLPIPSIYKGRGERGGQPIHVYDPITNWPVNDGLHVADGVGMAAVCIRRDVLARLERPWFAFDGEGGEDYFFCRKLQSIGVQILIDTGMSIGHVGEYEAHPEDWFRVKDDWMAQTGNKEIDIVRQEAAD